MLATIEDSHFVAVLGESAYHVWADATGSAEHRDSHAVASLLDMYLAIIEPRDEYTPVSIRVTVRY